MNFIICFSGQGLQNLQHIEELRAWAEEFKIVDTLQRDLPSLYAEDISEIDLYQNEFAQPFIFALQWCRWQWIRTLLDDVMAFSGYSLGELSALCCSTNTSFEQGLRLAHKRAMLMSHAAQQPSGLIAVQGINLNVLNPYLQASGNELSIKLSDSSFIIGGLNDNLQQLSNMLSKVGTRTIKRLNVSIPSHTSFMQTAVLPFHQELQQHTFSDLSIPIISGSGGHKYFERQDAVNALIQQMSHAIDWDSCMRVVQESLPDIVLEIGPGSSLSKMLLEREPNMIVRAVDDFKSRAGFETWLKGKLNI
ncbi:[acyl-carrier-protein] S-malonyltransferase [Acinetobacter marinus]|uniref:[acyl-carrier-protein] S-malonyltransferase n=1 Tax=Acinetobacter marinus TaxID=281375 RepID=A0A1G6JTP7_9GAMM|nr:acyltransferase domain-containing protein [Acinetobacter marinus]SDC22011.1 [acyl-carrier-protein] S-malonyltransferase [Acinetobacter marinus]